MKCFLFVTGSIRKATETTVDRLYRPRRTTRGDATPSGEHDSGALRMGMKMAYECKTRPDGLAFRKATNARPSRPVPSKSRLLGSGVGASPIDRKSVV